jgi:predicted ATPase
VKLVNAQVEKFRNIIDSGEFTLTSDVTCLVGKNESGKTAVLQALYRLNPVHAGDRFVALSHYPRRLFFKDRRDGVIDDVAPITATFELEPEDRKALDERFGPGTVPATRVVARRFYDNQLFVDLVDVVPDEANAVRFLVERAALGPGTEPLMSGVQSFDALRAVLSELQRTDNPAGGSTETANDIAAIKLGLVRMLGSESAFLADAVAGALVELLPTIFYFGEYELLEGRVDLGRLLDVPDGELTGGERTAKALLQLVGNGDGVLLNEDYEERKVELEAVSDMLTSQMAEYWHQSHDLAVTIDMDRTSEDAADGRTQVTHWLEVRVQDRRHGHTTNFNERSSGFRWFFSFLAAFSRYEGMLERIVILLDEPGLELHAKAQQDLVRFIEDRLGVEHQVVYTTHSPFMIEPTRMDRVRVVEDKGVELGTKVSADLTDAAPDTVYPLQTALASEMAGRLFGGSPTILVESASDLTHMQVLSEHLKSLGRGHLAEEWTVLSLPGLARLHTALALFGLERPPTVVASPGTEHQLLADLVRRGALPPKKVVLPGQVTRVAESDIEDLFDVGDYVAIFNLAFRDDGHPLLSSTELPPAERVVARIELVRGEYDRSLPAVILARHKDQIAGALSETTLSNFEQFFERVNATAF